MGAWNVNVDGNDAALDFLDVLIAEGFKIADCNQDYLLLADIIVKYGFVLGEEEFSKIETVIKEEIKNVDEWVKDAREDRLDVLKKLLLGITKLRM